LESLLSKTKGSETMDLKAQGFRAFWLSMLDQKKTPVKAFGLWPIVFTGVSL
jgi:hypothetical protein